MSDNQNSNKIYLFVDGPNCYKSSQDPSAFRIDIKKLVKVLEDKYGKIEKFFWYDVEPEISPIDLARVQTPTLKNILEALSKEKKAEKSLESIIAEHTNNIPSDNKKDDLIKEAINLAYSIEKTKLDYQKKVSFLNMIEKNKAEVILEKGKSFKYDVECPNCGENFSFFEKTEGGTTDFNLAIDLISYGLRNLYDTAILVSGDGHFVRPVNYIREAGKKVIVASFDHSFNKELKNAASEVIILNDLIEKISRKFK